MTVGELASRVGVTVRTIQYYDQRGLLHPTCKGEQNLRLYSPADEERLNRIITLKYWAFRSRKFRKARGSDSLENRQTHSRTVRPNLSAKARKSYET